MQKLNLGKLRARLAASVAVMAMSAGAAYAQSVDISLPAQSLADSLTALSQRTGENILFQPESMAGIRAQPLNGRMTPQEAIQKLIKGTGLRANSDGRGGVVVLRESFKEPAEPAFRPETHGVQLAQATQSGGGGEQSAEAAPPVEEVVVSGTRIVRNGYSAPTPVSVVTPEQLGTAATGNIADYVNQIPAFFGSTTPQSTNHSSSNAGAGLNALNLRSLGTNRTLVLLDGQRSVGSNTAGNVDINDIPQDLVTRVDIVTGGASAAYGSDAVAGVVNFVLDRTFQGTKADISGGVTAYGDDWQYRVRLTEGFAFDGGRGHVLISGEDADDNGIRGTTRPWEQTGYQVLVNPQYAATNGLPQYVAYYKGGAYTTGYGGVISAGPLAGTTFGQGGTPHTIQANFVSGNYFVGGDWQSQQYNFLNSLDPSLVANRIFTRVQYDLTDDIDVWGQFSWAGTRAFNVNASAFYVGNLTIKTDNAFIPASIAARIGALKLTSLPFGTLNGDLPTWSNASYRQTRRAVMGADGKFNAFGSDWTWNAYYQDGKTFGMFKGPGNFNVPNFMLAIDSVQNPATGQIQCRSTATTAPNNGCVPYDLFGTGVNSQAAVNYVEGQGNVSYQKLALEEQVWSATLNGNPFSDWAGQVSVATGIENRSEATNVTSDPQNGQWYGANYTPVKGHYSVTEGFLETVVPLARDEWFAKALDVNAAVRATDYSLAGYVTTWKIGATWDVIPDIRIRATRSRDIRAPNLAELFQTGAGGTNAVTDDFVAGRPQVLNTGVTTGNTNLKPETSDGTGLGVVFQPTFIDNFNMSVDYWEEDIKQAISSIGGQQVIDLCFQGFSQYCGQMTPDLSKLAAAPLNIVIITQPVNLASLTAEGLDFESDYRFAMSDLMDGLGGNMSFRWVGTHYITNTTNNNLTPPLQIVGSTLPKWRHNIIATYTNNPFMVSLTARITSSGVQNTAYIQCSTGCPTSTTSNPTINNNYLPGSFYLDTSINYNFEGPYSSDMQLYFNVQNIMNKQPGIVPEPVNFAPNISAPQTGAFDLLGRTFRLGVRLSM